MVKTFRLGNGVTGVVEERPGNGIVSMRVLFKAGSMHEGPGENGLTFLMQAAALGGTKTRKRGQIAEEIEKTGGEIESSTDRETTYFQADTVTRHAENVFAVLADIARNPVFSAAELRKTKTFVDQALIQNEESPVVRASTKFMQNAFADQAAGLPLAGTRAQVAGFTPEQLRKKHAELLAHPENIIVSFAGDIDAAAAEKLAKKYFDDLPKAGMPAKAAAATFVGGDAREDNDNEQMNIVLGFEAPPVDDHDMFVALLLKQYLSGGMSSVLFEQVREKRGLVYDISASYEPLKTTGLFTISAGAGKGNVGELLTVAMRVLGDVARKGIDPITLEQLREVILRERNASRELTIGLPGDNASEFASFGRVLSMEELEEKLKRVTSDDIRRVCANMLKEGKYALGAVGPQETMPPPQEIKNMMQVQVKGLAIPPRVATPVAKSAPKTVRQQQAPASTITKTTTMSNGIRIVTSERPGNMACGAWLKVGSDNESPSLGGEAHMLEHMIFKGTRSYKAGEIDRIVEKKLSGALNAETGTDMTAYFFARLKPDALEQVLDICSEMVFEATLDDVAFDGRTKTTPQGRQIKIKGERDVVIEELRISLDDVRDDSDLVLETAYPNQPHGRATIGTEKMLRAMTAQQLREFRDKFYVPNNVVFSVAGPVKHEDVVKILTKKLGHLKPGSVSLLPEAHYKGGIAIKEHREADLCNITLAAEAVSLSDPDNLAYEVLSMILAGGGSSRFYKKIVLDEELSSEVNSGTWDSLNGGISVFLTSVTPENVRPIVRSIYDEIRAVSEGVTQDEVDKIKNFFELNTLSGREKNYHVCERQARDMLAFGKPQMPEDLSEKLRKLTVDDIKRAAKKILASNPTVTIIVPPNTDRKYLPSHAEVVAMRDGKTPKAKAPKVTHTDIT